ncbi:MAG: aminoacyl-tRNA hydrolase [Pirellulaceae bacterium]|nr:aminoacyl-tRNA hydrolase [Pirellulaceae bacterium]
MVVGLGNPGPKYASTRHNIGFDVLEILARRQAADSPRMKFDGQLTTIKVAGQPVILFWPLTYMNESGRAVAAAVKFYKLDPIGDVLVVCDDLSLPLGKLRVRARGSSGGQKGLGDILRALGTQDIARLRVGIEPAPSNWDVADYVLSRFRKDEQDVIAVAKERAADAVELWCREGTTNCMNKVNGSAGN